MSFFEKGLLLAVFLYNGFMDNIENLGLVSYLNSQLASAWRMAADSSSYAETPEQYLCKTINMSLKTNPQTKVELDLFAQEAMKQLLSNSMLLRENGIPTENNSSFFDNSLNVAGKVSSGVGFYAGYKQYDLYIEAKWNNGVGKWKGKNGVWYMEKVEGKKNFFGNQYTGARKNIIAESEKYANIGSKLFWIGCGISIYQGIKSFQAGDGQGVIKAGADIAVGIIATWGGPVGWAISGIYMFLDLAGAFDPRYTKCVSPYANNPHAHLRDKTYVKPPVMPTYLPRRVSSAPTSNAVFRQGYKRY